MEQFLDLFYETFQLRVIGQRILVLIHEVVEKKGWSEFVVLRSQPCPRGAVTQIVLV